MVTKNTTARGAGLSNWGEFQSVLQLACGLNAAASIWDELRSPLIVRERKAIAALIDVARASKAHIAEATRMRDQFVGMSQAADVQDGAWKTLSMLFTPLSVALLFYSSFCFNDPISQYGIIACVGLFFPVAGTALHSVWSLTVAHDIGIARRQLQERMLFRHR
jgi:hypothetical protein